MTEDALVRRYARLAYAIARDFYFPGAEQDDVRQEALFGLLRAVRDFDPAVGTSFVPFAVMCIRRQLVTAVKAANRSKHGPLTESARTAVLERKTVDVLTTVADPLADPADVLERRDDFRLLVAAIGRLSDLERRSLLGIAAEGRTYVELDGPGGVKRADNACHRARWKLRRQLGLPLTTAARDAA